MPMILLVAGGVSKNEYGIVGIRYTLPSLTALSSLHALSLRAFFTAASLERSITSGSQTNRFSSDVFAFDLENVEGTTFFSPANSITSAWNEPDSIADSPSCADE